VILIVDDHPDSCEMLQRLVEKVGYRAHCVSSGGEALGFITAVRPRLVIVDLMMPEIDGLELLKMMKERDDLAGIPVIVYTGNSDPQLKERALTMGAIAYAIKGQSSLTQLLERINDVYLDLPLPASSSNAALSKRGIRVSRILVAESRARIRNAAELISRCRRGRAAPQ
jgi:CheY-like chemotaxis protein